MNNVGYITASNDVLTVFTFDELAVWAKQLPCFPEDDFLTRQEIEQATRGDTFQGIVLNVRNIKLLAVPVRDDEGVKKVHFQFMDEGGAGRLQDGLHRFCPSLN